mmetsp:Transcript_58029/g.106730  ORF Transcript_58029/g.106730 Transcript_58029/m.106730 type:complete len:357 (+) Transcript_58029:1-1071(+)
MQYSMPLVVSNVTAAFSLAVPAPTATRQLPKPSDRRPVMDAVHKLRQRVASISESKKKAWSTKFTAAAKVRRAFEAVHFSRAFMQDLENIVDGLLRRLAYDGTATRVPVLQKRNLNTYGLVVITGDRELCAGFNAAVILRAQQRIAKLRSQGYQVELITIGKKGSDYFRSSDVPMFKTYDGGPSPGAARAKQIFDDLLFAYGAGKIDRVEVLYTRFDNLVFNRPVTRTLIPLIPDGNEVEDDEILKAGLVEGDMTFRRQQIYDNMDPSGIVPEEIFDQAPAQVVNTVLMLYGERQLWRTLQESFASELAARMQATVSDTQSIVEKRQRLSQEVQQARQSQITQDLLEVLGGAESLL